MSYKTILKAFESTMSDNWLIRSAGELIMTLKAKGKNILEWMIVSIFMGLLLPLASWAAVTIDAVVPVIVESESGQFVVSMDPPAVVDTTVSYVVSGASTAEPGYDYTPFPNSVTIGIR
jgi:hypothetical protein